MCLLGGKYCPIFVPTGQITLIGIASGSTSSDTFEMSSTLCSPLSAHFRLMQRWFKVTEMYEFKASLVFVMSSSLKLSKTVRLRMDRGKTSIHKSSLINSNANRR